MGCIITKYLDECSKERKKRSTGSSTSIILQFSKRLSNYEFEPEYNKKIKEFLKSKLLKEEFILSLLKELQSKIYPYSLDPLRYFLTFMCFIISLTSMVFALVYEDLIENTLPEPKKLISCLIGTLFLSYFSHLVLLTIFTLRKNVMVLRKVNNAKKIVHDYNIKILNPIGYIVEVSNYGSFMRVKKVLGDLVVRNDYDVKVLDEKVFKIKVEDKNLDVIGEEDSTCDSDEIVEEVVDEEHNAPSFRLESSMSQGDHENWVPESTERCMITVEAKDG